MPRRPPSHAQLTLDGREVSHAAVVAFQKKSERSTLGQAITDLMKLRPNRKENR